MKIVATAGRKDIAMVYVGEFNDGELVEFVEAVQPPIPLNEKWVIMVSTLYGCPVECKMCDAGGFYHGKVSKERIFEQIDYIVDQRFPDRAVPSKQFKIQFARMGEPSFNMDVLKVLREFQNRYEAPGFMPSISTIAPNGTDEFFSQLIDVKNEIYSRGQFQFQYSIHTTDEELRNKIIPVKKWNFSKMAEYGDKFYSEGDRKITLNFALAEGSPVEPNVLLDHFDPEKYLIKITPLNPTYSAESQGLQSYINPNNNGSGYKIVDNLKEAGYQVIVSIGETEENLIGSNCGQYILKHVRSESNLKSGYLYQVE